LDAVTDGNWDMKIIEKDGDLAALMPLCQKSKYGLHAVYTPQLTPFFGIYILPHHFEKTTKYNSYQNELIDSLLKTIPNFHYYLIPYHHSFNYGFPLVYNGYKSTIRYTYQLDNIKDEEKLFLEFKSSLRNKIRKAEKNITIEESNDIDIFYDTINKTFERQKLSNPTSKNLISNIYKALPENSKILLAKDESESLHAAHFLVWDDKCAYNLMLGGDTELRSSGAIPLLLWNSIKTASKYVDTYDFEGSILPTVQPFFESFGANVVSYHQYYKAKNKMWELLFNLTNKF
jgi:lipid II:glycine glycyltransferase (peptidoglycan interpeptide bridge formation enzyme)